MAVRWRTRCLAVGSCKLSKTQQPVIWVSRQDELDALCRKWLNCPLLAVDTEFMRTNTFYPLPALLQINDGAANYLVDPLAITDVGPLAEVMTSPAVQKALHSCSEDLDVFYTLLRCLPVNLLDTQVAAAFCGYGFSLGYGNLVQAMLNVDLPKGETRSDWLQRPLTEAQKIYAAMDVEYLYQIASTLNQRLLELERSAWVEEETALLISNYIEGQNPDNAVGRFKGAWRLEPRQLAALSALARWRDQQAQARDVPRGYVLKDKSVLGVAELLPEHVGQLRKVPELSDKAIRRYGETIIELVAQILALAPAQLPARVPRPATPKQQDMIKQMREKLIAVAEQHKIAPEYLARKKDYEFMARAVTEGKTGEAMYPQTLQGWRANIVKPEIESIL